MEHLAGTSFSKLDIKHKTDMERFVRAEPNGKFRAFVVNLYDKWHQYNREYFNDKFEIPTYITLGNTSAPNTFGEYSSVSSWGGTSEIRIKPSLFQGKHPHIKKFLTQEGRHRFMFDVLLHEQVHQYQHEYLKSPEDSYKGHGPVFRDECNRISELLGITQKVRTCKKRGKDKDLPSCAQWPHNVRPEGYYGPMVEEPEIVEPKGPVEPETGVVIDYDYIKNLCDEFLTEDERDRLSADICRIETLMESLYLLCAKPTAWVSIGIKSLTDDDFVEAYDYMTKLIFPDENEDALIAAN